MTGIPTRLTLTTRGASADPQEIGSIELSPEFEAAHDLREIIGCGAMGMVHRPGASC